MSSAQTLHAQEIAARRAGGSRRSQRAAPLYPGLATRAVALALDAVAINALALAVGGVVVLCASLLHLPDGVERVAAIVGAGLWLAWSIGYFATFWSTTGQTPGDRVMRICVRDAHEPPQRLRLGRALLRFGALVLGAIPLFAGYLPVLLDARRRAFHDRVATTVVVHVEPDQHAVGRGVSTP